MNASVRKEQLKARVVQAMIDLLEEDVYGRPHKDLSRVQQTLPWAGLIPTRKTAPDSAGWKSARR